MKGYSKIKCQECGKEAHFIEAHLKMHHPEMTLDEYITKHPGAATISIAGEKKRASIIEANQLKPIVGSIKKLFGISVFGARDEIMMFEKPHVTTPPIDPDYKFEKETLAYCLYSVANKNQPMLLQGPTGSGKSSIITQIAARLNYPFYRINCDMDISRADFVGQWVLRGKEMAFQYGILPIAARVGGIMVVDEWDAANPGVSMALQAVLEDNGKLTIAETGEVIAPADYFRIFCTANTLGMGDETGLYNGTQPQNFAALDRFKQAVTVNYPKEAVEKEIVKKKTGLDDKEILNKILEYATLIRNAFVKEEIRTTMSTRTIINIAEKIIDFGDVRMAYSVAYINKCSGEDRKFAEECLQRVWAV